MATVKKTEPAINKVAAIALIGASVEWYDFFLYGTAAALVFPKLFFSADLPPLIALLAAFSTFAVGFLARPLGAILFGHYGDKVGRKKALVFSMVLMGTATTLIGLLPSYMMVGALAPLLLITLRIAQGLAVGGQWGGAVLLVTETAPAHRRGFYGSFAQAGVPVGVILANLAFLLVSSNLSEDSFMTWGWRVPFLLSVFLIAVGLYVQLYLEETPAFRQLQAIKEHRDANKEKPVRTPLFEALSTYPKEIFLAAGAFMASTFAFYILITFAVAYGTGELGVSRNIMLFGVLVGAFLMVPALLISARISDKYGRRGIYFGGSILLFMWSFAIFPLIQTGEPLWITLAISVGLIIVSMMYGPQAAFLSEMFPTRMRYSAASLGYQIGTLLSGAVAPLIATVLLHKFDNTISISIYMAINCTITAICIVKLKETYKADLDRV